MGWLFTHGQPRKALIADRIRPWQNMRDDRSYTAICHKHCCRGNVLWTVWCITIYGKGDTPEGNEWFIGCDLMQYNKHSEGWGYKDMCEKAHPYYYSCPLSYLDMAPVASEAWRRNVRVWHSERSVIRRIKRELKSGVLSRIKAVEYLRAVTGMAWQ